MNTTPQSKMHSVSVFQAYCLDHACELLLLRSSDTAPASLISISRASARLLLSDRTAITLRPGDRVYLNPCFSGPETPWTRIESEVTEVRARDVMLRFAHELPVTCHRLHRITRR